MQNSFFVRTTGGMEVDFFQPSDYRRHVVRKSWLFLWAEADQKTLDPHREVQTLMTGALSRSMIYFDYFYASQNASRAESLSLKARTVRPPKGRTWNQKNLDYEIETSIESIHIGCDMYTWNQKNLDYEIETRISGMRDGNRFTWNQKNLDYEIETWASSMSSVIGTTVLEIKRTSITRLKHSWILPLSHTIHSLKSKEPRLRDWNLWNICFRRFESVPLEIKRTSITRLKPETSRVAHVAMIWNLKSKEPRLRDWNMTQAEAENPNSDLKSKEPRLRDWNIVFLKTLADFR